MRIKIVILLIALAAAFLAGFVPRYREARELREELQFARQEIQALQTQRHFAELRDLIAIVFLETSEKNFGLAARQSTQFFNRVQQLLAQTTDPEPKSLLQEITDSRDSVTAGLASGDSAVLGEVQSLFRKIHERTRP